MSHWISLFPKHRIKASSESWKRWDIYFIHSLKSIFDIWTYLVHSCFFSSEVFQAYYPCPFKVLEDFLEIRSFFNLIRLLLIRVGIVIIFFFLPLLEKKWPYVFYWSYHAFYYYNIIYCIPPLFPIIIQLVIIIENLPWRKFPLLTIIQD